ncbi:MAG: hypothetical protein NVSMB64_14640 [Candidatus Velthaea sp.]
MKGPPYPSALGSGSTLDRLVAVLRGTAVLDLIGEGVVLYRLDGSLAYANATAARLIGRRARPGQRVFYYTHLDPAVLEQGHAQFAAVLETGRTAEFESALIDADGSRVEVAARFSRAFVRDEFVGVYAVATDTTAQNLAEQRLMRSQLQFRSLFEHHPDSIVMVKADGTASRMNRAAELLTGMRSEEHVGRPNVGIVQLDKQEQTRKVVIAAHRGESATFDTTIVRKDGTPIDIEGVAIPIVVDGKSEGYFAVSRDVRQERRQRAELALASQRIHELYLVAATDAANPRHQILRALTLGVEQLDFEFGFVARAADGKLLFTDVAGPGQAFRVGDTIDIERALARHAIAQDSLFFIEDTAAPPWPDDPGSRPGVVAYLAIPLAVGGQPYGLMAFTSKKPHAGLPPIDRDFAMALAALTAGFVERILQAERLDALAFYDKLTGLPNRALLIDRLERLIATARRHQRRFALHFIDFDNFKEVNDRFGHAVGDEFLTAMGARLAVGLRESDTLGRLGGDEFVILQPDIENDENALECAARLVSMCNQLLRTGDESLSVTMSIGVAVFPDDGNDAETLMANADAALYTIKAAGRNGFRRYDATMQRHARRYIDR